MPTATTSTRPTALAATLRISIARLNRRLRTERSQRPDGDATGGGDDRSEVSLGQLAVLGRLHREGPATPGTLAQAERVKRPSMTKIIAALEEDGMVQRTPHPDDRRQVLVSPTERGVEVLLAERRRREAWLARALTRLSPAERALLAQAAPLLERLSTSEV